MLKATEPTLVYIILWKIPKSKFMYSFAVYFVSYSITIKPDCWCWWNGCVYDFRFQYFRWFVVFMLWYGMNDVMFLWSILFIKMEIISRKCWEKFAFWLIFRCQSSFLSSRILTLFISTCATIQLDLVKCTESFSKHCIFTVKIMLKLYHYIQSNIAFSNYQSCVATNLDLSTLNEQTRINTYH